MRYKVVPEARSVDFLREARAALPLVPATVEDCCTRVRDRTSSPSRDDAREVLTLLQALGLAGETERGFHRTREDLTVEDVGERFRENVFGVREVTDALTNERTLTPTEAFDHLREEVPRWERDRSADWETEWEARTHRLLEWSRAFGLVERDGDAYCLADGGQ